MLDKHKLLISPGKEMLTDTLKDNKWNYSQVMSQTIAFQWYSFLKRYNISEYVNAYGITTDYNILCNMKLYLWKLENKFYDV